jgi:hypothetical protein
MCLTQRPKPEIPVTTALVAFYARFSTTRPIGIPRQRRSQMSAALTQVRFIFKNLETATEVSSLPTLRTTLIGSSRALIRLLVITEAKRIF